ncbi:tetratricopeptide repeat protein [Pontibacter sp. MBLB2868]|uniref:type IX secretion system periplasmic lipoprotein PorW/SprE n=1 Tax=Pontibacter sp. MBLB2868 TaxID=3451555 RepID=UPI003F74FC5C
MNNKPLHIFYVVVVILLTTACSAERNNPVSKTYHNTTARYNGYFLANEKMHAVENTLQEQMQYDYNQVLPQYPAFDSSTSKALATDLEDILKKASYPIQYHKNSKWVDNSYILVGKANYYQLKFAEAARTFKYVNSTSKDPDDRHEALVWLMRTFMKMGEMDNAQQVSEYLRKERLNRDNARELYLARAQYYTLLQDTAAVIENLELSLPNFKEKDDQSRTRFALAQLFQLTNQDDKAYKQYSKVLRRNPPYDLGFFSRLNLGQVTELTDERDKERIAGYYQKLLKDEKNKEYRDKILYEMAQFELRQQNYQKALSLLEESLRTPGALQNQKAYSYVSAGEIYFDNLNKYDLAAAYYDSAAQVYPQQAPEYASVTERRDILAEFARQFSTIQTQDSLQRLARMSESERNVFLQQLAQQQEEQRLQEVALQEQQSSADRSGSANNRSRKNGEALATNSSGGLWYFDNPVAMASARAEFTRRWGDRPLQDFWRIRSRGETGNEAQIASTTQDNVENKLSTEERAQAAVQQYLQDIPLTNAAMARSEKQVEDAYFKLANIYSQNLKDATKATQTFEELLRRFPNTEHAADAYYSLYLLYGKAGDNAKLQNYYSKIKQQFPNTTYARLVDDANFLSKNAADNQKAHQLYDEAYSYYEHQKYDKATSTINVLVSQYPFNDIQDKVAFLEAMVTARTQKPEALRLKLSQFVTAYPKSPLVQQANDLLATYKDLEQKNQLRQEAPVAVADKPEAASAMTPEEKVSTEIASATASASKDSILTLPTVAAGKTAQQEGKQQKEAAVEVPPVTETKLPEITEPAATSTVAPALPTDSAKTATTPAAPPVDPLAYKAAVDTAYYFVLVYPEKEAAFKDIQQKFEKYNSTYYGKQNLTIVSLGFSNNKAMLVVQTFSDPTFAQSFNIKQKAPQSPIGRIRGVDFVTFVISSANYQKLLQKKDLDTYLTFFKNNY